MTIPLSPEGCVCMTTIPLSCLKVSQVTTTIPSSCLEASRAHNNYPVVVHIAVKNYTTNRRTKSVVAESGSRDGEDAGVMTTREGAQTRLSVEPGGVACARRLHRRRAHCGGGGLAEQRGGDNGRGGDGDNDEQRVVGKGRGVGKELRLTRISQGSISIDEQLIFEHARVDWEITRSKRDHYL